MNRPTALSCNDIVSPLAAYLRLAGFGLLLVAIWLPHLFQRRFSVRDRLLWPRLFHRGLLRIMGFRVRVSGAPMADGPVLFVGNHTSYLDIPVLGSVIPGSFVAKAELARWPLFGFMARMQETLFIERVAARTAAHRTAIRARLEKGDNLILFPEGTSTDGNRVLPFKSGLLSVAADPLPDGRYIAVQPVSIVCSERWGLPLLRVERPYYSWFGDMDLAPHLWAMFRMGGMTIDVILHPPLYASAYPDRKALTQAAEISVLSGVQRSELVNSP